MLLLIPGILLGCALVLAGALLARSPGRPEPLTDQNGELLKDGVSEKRFVTIGGVRQGMFIRGKDVKNPVLLFLHGGPGMPEYFLAEQYPTGLEDRFTVCYWEQRGAGISYDPAIPAETITAERLVSDTIEVTHYLRGRFGQEKIFLMAHSWGSYIGIRAAAKAPELYRAYIGVAQIANVPDSEKTAYAYMLERYAADGNDKRVREMKNYPVLESDAAVRSFFTSALRDQTMHELGVGTMRGMRSVITGVFLPVMRCWAYTFAEKINIWRAKAFLRSGTGLLDQLFSADLPQTVDRLAIPAYFCSGLYDYTVNYRLSRAYLERLQAPVKGFYTFGQSAHSPMFEEPDTFMRVVAGDVLTGTNGLADADETA